MENTQAMESTGEAQDTSSSTQEASESVQSAPEQSSEPSHQEESSAEQSAKPLESWDEAMQTAPSEESEEEASAEESQETAPSKPDPMQALHKVKIDGKETDVPLQDLINNYSGKVAYDKKFNELNIERQKFKAELDGVYGDVAKFNELLSSGKAMDAIAFLGQFASIPPHHIKNVLVQSLKPEYDRIAALSPEQRQAEFYKQEAEYLRQMRESDVARSKSQQAAMELEQASMKMRETHNIAEGEWSAVKSTLEKEKAEGRLNENITPDLIAEIVLDSRFYGRAESAVKKVSPELLKNEKLVKTLVFHAKENPDFTDDDLVEIVSKAYGTDQKQAVAAKLANKVVEKKVVPQPQQKQPTQSYSESEAAILKQLFGSI